jgi:hypothetical protein
MLMLFVYMKYAMLKEDDRLQDIRCPGSGNIRSS